MWLLQRKQFNENSAGRALKLSIVNSKALHSTRSWASTINIVSSQRNLLRVIKIFYLFLGLPSDCFLRFGSVPKFIHPFPFSSSLTCPAHRSLLYFAILRVLSGQCILSTPLFSIWFIAQLFWPSEFQISLWKTSNQQGVPPYFTEFE